MTNYAEHFAMSKYASSADRSSAMLAELERLKAERDAALQASRYESDLCGQALEDIKAATAERDAIEEQAVENCDEVLRLREELANLKALDIHSCHAGCTRAGCVAARLREERVYGKWVSEGEALGFDRPPRRYGMEPLWANERATAQKGE